MPDTNTPELIRIIGGRIVELDELRCTVNRDTPERKRLDSLRDMLDTYQRKIVREWIHNNTDEFKALTVSLTGVNDGLKNTIKDVTKIAQTLDNLVKFVGVVEKIVSLIPK